RLLHHRPKQHERRVHQWPAHHGASRAAQRRPGRNRQHRHGHLPLRAEASARVGDNALESIGMTTYSLYLESGPRRRKTSVHVLDLLGCVAVGPTTEGALAATPDAIRAYRCFLHRHGETVAPDAPFGTRVVEHVTEGMWLGNGSPYLVFGPDLEPVT